MELSINSKVRALQFRFEHTKHKLGVKIWGDRRSFHELHELLGECWDCEDDCLSQAEACSYIGVISYFSYEVRHAFMGDRLVLLDGKPMKEWTDEMFQLFEQEQERFEVGLELTWPHMLFIMASWWECLKHQNCPMRAIGVMKEFSANIERLLQSRGKAQYTVVEPYIHGAIYAANTYLMHYMEHINVSYLMCARMFHKVSNKELADEMERSAYGTYYYDEVMSILKHQVKKLGCPIEEICVRVDKSVYDMEL